MKRYIRSTITADDAASARRMCLNTFHNVIGDLWRGKTGELTSGCEVAYSDDTYTKEEAEQALAELNDALKQARLKQYVTRTEYYGSAFSTDHPFRIAMTLKKAISFA